jgi:hypothetical protein
LSTLPPGVQDLLSIAVLYVVVLTLFRGLVFSDSSFSQSPDASNHHSYKIAGNALRDAEGVDPLWTPYVFSGMPTFGSLSYIPHNVSYPEAVGFAIVRALFLYTPMSWFVALYFLGGVFMFFLMRWWHFSRPAALLAALTFMLSPYAVTLGGVGHGSKMKALSYLPLMVLLTHLLFEKRNLLTFGLLCAGIGTLMLTNHVQVVYYVLLVMGSYLVYHVVLDLKERRAQALTKTLMFAGAFAVGLCISAYIYLSVLEYAQFSIRGGGTAGSAGGLTWDYATNWSVHPAELLTLAIPSFFGFQSPYYWGWMPFTSSTFYAGIIPLVLTLIAVAYRRERLSVFFMILTGIVLLMSFGKYFPLLYQVMFDYLPFFNKFRAPSTILHLLPFCFGVLGAFGFSALPDIAKDPARAAQLRKVLTFGALALVGILMIGTVTKDTLYKGLSDFMFVKEGEVQQYQQQYGARTPQVIEQIKQIRFYGNEDVSGFWGDTVRFLLLSASSMGLIALFLGGKVRSGLLAGGLMLLLVLDLFIVDARFIRPVPARSLDDGFRPDGTITFLKQQPGLFRVFPVGGEHFGNNTYAYHGIQSLGGYNAAKLKIYQTMIDSCFFKPTTPGIPVNMNVVNMLSARYLVTSFQLPGDHFVPVHADPSRGATVYENPSSLPRAFFVRTVATAKTDSDVFRLINSPGFDPSVTAILQEDPGLKEPDSTSVEVVEYQSRRITLRAYASEPALLVLSEVYYPAGWKAFVDGQEARILRTNSILRSVIVPQGKHEVVFSFDPESYSVGWTATNTAWGISALCIIAGIWSIPSVRERLRGRTRKDSREV